MAIQPLSFRITADLSGFNAGLSQVTTQLRSVADRVRGAFQGAAASTNTSLASTGTGVSTLMTRLGGLAAAYAALRSVQTFTRIADEAALATARIQGLTGSVEQTREAQGALFELSQRLQTGYSEAVGSFSRMLPAVKELGGGVKETTALTEILLTTAKLSGASAAESAASAMQFAQALGSGKLQGDELRSILENNNTLARTLAAGLGVSIGELRRMGEEGKLTSDLVANTLLGAYDDIKSKAADLPTTVGGAWTQIRNAFTLFVTQLENGTGIFGAVAAVLSELSKVIVAVATAFFGTSSEADRLGQNQAAQNFAQSVGSAFAQLADIVRALGGLIWNLGSLVVEVFKGIGDTIGGVAAMAVAAIKGDFAGAAAIWDEMGARGEATAERLRSAFSDSIEQTINAFQRQGDAYRAYTEQTAAAPAGGAGKLSGGGGGGDKGGLTDKQVARQIDAEMDAIQKSIDAERKRFAVAQEVAQIRTEMDRDRALAAIEAEQRVSRFQLDNQQITQQQYLAAELVFEEQKYAIRRAAVERQLELAKAEGRDPAEVERINAQLLALELDFQTRKQQIGLEVEQASTGGAGGRVVGSAWDAVRQSMGQALDGMLTRAKTFGQAMAGIWGNMRAAIVGEIGKMLLAKVAAFAREKLLAMAGISANAAEAGSGAAKALAGIPIIGPGLAAAAVPAMVALVSGLSSGIKSAAGGFDIPAGLNPVTQLHAEEMVLPADIANPMRDMLSGDRAPQQTVELRGVSAGEFFIANRRELLSVLKGAVRDFAV